jgi:hypothetical protein
MTGYSNLGGKVFYPIYKAVFYSLHIVYSLHAVYQSGFLK